MSYVEFFWIVEDLLLWKYDEYGFDELMSVGMCYKGEVVGWVIVY